MKNIATRLSVFVLIAMVGLNGCKDDDDAKKCENGVFEATVNGENETGSSFDNTLLKVNNGAVQGKRMDIRATDAEGRQLIISFNDNSTGTTGNGVSTEEYISVDEITTGTENTFFFTIIEDGMSYPFINGSLDITSCDADAKQVSGTFSFSEGEFEVTNGSFTNMCYRVM